MVAWALRRLVIFKRVGTTMNNDGFCCGFFTHALVRSWCDYSMSVGLDCRCVLCIVTFMSRIPPQRSMTKRMRNWMPRANNSDQPLELPNFVFTSLSSVQNQRSFALENIRVDAANATGHFPAQTFIISSFTTPSATSITRKKLGLQIRSLHRKKIRISKSQNLAGHFADVSTWRCFKKVATQPCRASSCATPIAR